MAKLKNLFKKLTIHSSIKHTIIYHVEDRSLILFQFSKDYLSNAVEFCSGLTNTKNINCTMVDDSQVDESDTMYYLLVSIIYDYDKCINNLKDYINLSNKFLIILSDISFENIDNTIDIKDNDYIDNIDDIKLIMDRLPYVFNIVDVMPYFYINNIYDGEISSIKNMYNTIQDLSVKNILELFLYNQLGLPIESCEKLLILSKFEIDVDELNTPNGDIKDVDDLFKQHIDKFIGNEENLVYNELIDEIIEDDKGEE